MLDVGCGIGRNLQHLDADAVGVDHNQDSVTIARRRGLRAYVPEAFFHSPDACEGSFDSMLLAHVMEHLDADVADELVRTYLPFLRLIGAVGAFLPPVEDPYLPAFLADYPVYAVVKLAAALLLAAVVAAALFRVAGPRVTDLGVAVLTLSLLGGPFLVLLNAVVNGTYFGIPPRYGLTLVAPAAALTAVLLRGRRTGLGLLAVGLIGAVLVAVGTVR